MALHYEVRSYITIGYWCIISSRLRCRRCRHGEVPCDLIEASSVAPEVQQLTAQVRTFKARALGSEEHNAGQYKNGCVFEFARTSGVKMRQTLVFAQISKLQEVTG